jgi:sialate O-acetylesterase
LKEKKILLFAILLSLGGAVIGQVVLPRLVRDSMVLQRDTEIKLWGWAAPKEKIAINFKGKTTRTAAGPDGKWTALLPAMQAGGPYTLKIDATNHLVLKDILVGDVFICAGQSNMVHQMELHKERYVKEIQEAHYPRIRQFWIPTLTSLQGPRSDLPAGTWKDANSQNVLQFSAVAYFFAKKLYEKYGVPIGLINASVGGTPIEAWTSEEGLKQFPEIAATIQKNKDTAYLNNTLRAMAAAEAARPRPVDKGLTGNKLWHDTSYSPQGWRTITVPGYWEDQGIRNLDGIVWYRKEIDISSAIAGSPGKIALGRIVDADLVYLNGKLIGQTGYQYPQRRYSIPPGLLKEGKNLLVVKVVNYGGKGGFVPDKPYYLTAGDKTIDLKGDWQYKVGVAFAPYWSGVQGISVQNAPTSLYNSMVAPLTNFAIKGVLWYQGESNIDNAAQYQSLLKALIEDWRNGWQNNSLPFLYAQLPNYDDVQYLPTESPWAVLRDAQLKTLSLPHTGMAVTIDVGEWNDIHPDRKKEVGERLALAAEYEVYNDKSVVPTGPIYKSSTINDNKITIAFRHTGSGLIAKDGEELSEFAIAGADKKFVWAKAKIEGDKVIVWNEGIPSPLYVRYAWADNPDNPNLFNKEGLPASPFKTD